MVGEVFQRQQSTPKGLFFTLTDLEDNAAINCVAPPPPWRSQLAKLTTLPKAGEQVTILGTVKVYPPAQQLPAEWCGRSFPPGDGLKALRTEAA